jgi:hypothetical protein
MSLALPGLYVMISSPFLLRKRFKISVLKPKNGFFATRAQRHQAVNFRVKIDILPRAELLFEEN